MKNKLFKLKYWKSEVNKTEWWDYDSTNGDFIEIFHFNKTVIKFRIRNHFNSFGIRLQKKKW